MVARPKTDKALGQWLGWLGATPVRRHHEHYHSRGGGHLYQGRFKSFPVAEDDSEGYCRPVFKKGEKCLVHFYRLPVSYTVS